MMSAQVQIILAILSLCCHYVSHLCWCCFYAHTASFIAVSISEPADCEVCSTILVKSSRSPQSAEGLYQGGVGDARVGCTLYTPGRISHGETTPYTQLRSIGKSQSKVSGTVPYDEWHQGYMMQQTVRLRHQAEPHCTLRLTLYRRLCRWGPFFPAHSPSSPIQAEKKN